MKDLIFGKGPRMEIFLSNYELESILGFVESEKSVNEISRGGGKNILSSPSLK